MFISSQLTASETITRNQRHIEPVSEIFFLRLCGRNLGTTISLQPVTEYGFKCYYGSKELLKVASLHRDFHVIE